MENNFSDYISSVDHISISQLRKIISKGNWVHFFLIDRADSLKIG